MKIGQREGQGPQGVRLPTIPGRFFPFLVACGFLHARLSSQSAPGACLYSLICSACVSLVQLAASERNQQKTAMWLLVDWLTGCMQCIHLVSVWESTVALLGERIASRCIGN